MVRWLLYQDFSGAVWLNHYPLLLQRRLSDDSDGNLQRAAISARRVYGVGRRSGTRRRYNAATTSLGIVFITATKPAPQLPYLDRQLHDYHVLSTKM